MRKIKISNQTLQGTLEDRERNDEIKELDDIDEAYDLNHCLDKSDNGSLGRDRFGFGTKDNFQLINNPFFEVEANVTYDNPFLRVG